MRRPDATEDLMRDLWVASISDPVVQLAAWKAIEASGLEKATEVLAWNGDSLELALRQFVLKLLGKSQ